MSDFYNIQSLIQNLLNVDVSYSISIEENSYMNWNDLYFDFSDAIIQSHPTKVNLTISSYNL